MIVQTRQPLDKNVDVVDYGDILTAYGISFQEQDRWLYAGTLPEGCKWTIYLSARALDGASLLEQVAPVLKSLAINFKVLRDNYALNKSNGYGFGLDSVGKFLVAAADSDTDAVGLIRLLQPISEQYGGPMIQGAIRLGKIIYGQSNELIHYKSIPFSIAEQYRPKKRGRVMGKYYLPIQVLGAFPKGETIKAINLRRLKLSWCLIKQGRIDASDDFFGRDMTDRLLWQYQVLTDLHGFPAVPSVEGFFRDKDAAFLVLEFFEGIPLRQKVLSVTGGKCWKELSVDTQLEVLRYYLEAVRIVEQVHERGYLHRDLTDENFIVTTKDTLKLIDFELSWSVDTKQPHPPFGSGTAGYMSPQQQGFAIPEASDDVYSLGAVLVFLLSGRHPLVFSQDAGGQLSGSLAEMTLNPSLSVLAVQCTSTLSSLRPGIKEIKEKIAAQIEDLNKRETMLNQNTKS